MSFLRNRFVGLVLLLAVAMLGAACGDDANGETPTGADGEPVSGEILISGSSTVEPISSLVAEKFQSANPEVSVTVNGPGTSDGFELFCNGEIDISDASRPIDVEEEVPACEENGVEFIELKVAIDGLSVITSPDNEVSCLNFGDLYALTGPESKGFSSWSDANALGEEVGGIGTPYPDADLVITAPGEESGTYDYYVETVIEPIGEERGLPEEEWVARPDYQASANDNVIIEGVSGSSSSLGWVGYAFFVQNEGAVKALEIDGGDGCVAPTPETIADTSYPISRFLYIYVDANKIETNDALKAYVDYYFSEEGLASVSEVGYVDLDDADLQESLDAWEAGETGTREG
jgi:phosphate transport system substrate-binding protein